MCYRPVTVVRALLHLILRITKLCNHHYNFHFTEEKIEAYGSKEICIKKTVRDTAGIKFVFFPTMSTI